MKRKKYKAQISNTAGWIKDIMQQKQFYTRSSLKRLLEKTIVDIEFPLETISKALKKLKNQNFVTYNKSTKFWVVTRKPDEDKTPKCNCEKSITNAEAEIIKSLEKVTEAMGIKILTAVAENIVSDILTEKGASLIISTTQKTTLEELRTVLKPTLHEYIDHRVKEATSSNSDNMLKLFNEKIDSVERRLDPIYKFISSLKSILP